MNAMSPILTMGIATLAIWGMSYYNWSFSWWKISVEDVHLESGAIVTITILAGLCVIAEGLLIRRMAMKVTTPCIEKTKRGMQAIVYRSKMYGYYLFSLLFLVMRSRLYSHIGHSLR